MDQIQEPKCKNEENVSENIFEFKNIQIKFPFKLYTIQRNYMRQVLRSLDESRNALLESPTGTGKTLSVLCSSLAWLNKEIKLRKDKTNASFQAHNRHDHSKTDSNDESDEELSYPRIFFSSRTHSQLSQSIKELKKNNYGSNSGVVLAGRDLLCINDDVTKLGNISLKNQSCKSKKGSNSCAYYKDFESKCKKLKEHSKRNPVLDVEDLIAYGKENETCPFFAASYLKKRSNVVFLPYNYLIDPKIRDAQKLEFHKDVVIFDEGHNIEKICEDSVSVDLPSDSIACCIQEMDNIHKTYLYCIERLDKQNPETLNAIHRFTTEDLCLLKMVLENLDHEIDLKVKNEEKKKLKEFRVDSNEKYGFVCDDEFIFDLLTRIDLSFNIQRIIEIIGSVISFLICALRFKGQSILKASIPLSLIKDFLKLFKPNRDRDPDELKKEFKKKFKVYIEYVEKDPNSPTLTSLSLSISNTQTKTNNRNDINHWLSKSLESEPIEARKWVLHIWCLSPSIAMKGLIDSNIRSVILTSGTLAPLASYEPEFETEFRFRIQNPHVINKSQVSIFTINESSDRTILNSSYNNIKSDKYCKALGDTILDICTNVPDGILLFFSSYNVKNSAIKIWKENLIYSKIDKEKKIFHESKNRQDFDIQILNFRNRIDSGKGAIFIGICRGKLSEGIDLSGKYTRGVILAGLPYPAYKDPKLVLKREYLDKSNYENYSSKTWYELQMKRALNQAIGRVIRNKDDYGCVFLLDYRFQDQTGSLSKWCRGFVSDEKDYDKIINLTKRFFTLKEEVDKEELDKEVDKEEVDKEQIEGDLIDFDWSPSRLIGNDNVEDIKDDIEEANRKRKNDLLESSFEILRPKRSHLAIEYEVSEDSKLDDFDCFEDLENLPIMPDDESNESFLNFKF